MSEASRLAGVFFEPTKTFEDVAARPRFWVLLIVVILNGLLVMTPVTQDRMVGPAMEKNPQTRQLPADQRERTIELATRFGPMLYGFTFIGTPLTFLVLAAIYAVQCRPTGRSEGWRLKLRNAGNDYSGFHAGGVRCPSPVILSR